MPTVLAIKGGVAFLFNNVDPEIAAVIFKDPNLVRLFSRAMSQGNIVRFQQLISTGNMFENVKNDEEAAQFMHDFYEFETVFKTEGFYPVPFEFDAAQGATLADEPELLALGEALLEYLPAVALDIPTRKIVFEKFKLPAQPDAIIQKQAQAAAEKIGIKTATTATPEEVLKLIASPISSSGGKALQAAISPEVSDQVNSVAAYGLTFTFWRKLADTSTLTTLRKWTLQGPALSFLHIVTAPPQPPFTLIPQEGQTLSWYDALFFGQSQNDGYIVLSLPGGAFAVNIHVPARVGDIGTGPYYQTWSSGDENALPPNDPMVDAGWETPVDDPAKPYTFPRDFGGYKVHVTSQATGETLMLTIEILGF